MDTNEILDLYKTRWNEINERCNHGNISVQRAHTHFMQLTAETIQQICTNIIRLENTINLASNPAEVKEMIEGMKDIVAGRVKPLTDIDSIGAAKFVGDRIDKEMADEVQQKIAIETTVDRIIRESMDKSK